MADPNPLRRPPAVANTHGKLYEPRLAKAIGGSLRPNSGAMPGAKGDMQSKDKSWLLEVKTTINATLSVDFGWLVKISEEASRSGQRPALALAFVLPTGRPRPNASSEWVMIPKHIWQEMTE